MAFSQNEKKIPLMKMKIHILYVIDPYCSALLILKNDGQRPIFQLMAIEHFFKY